MSSRVSVPAATKEEARGDVLSALRENADELDEDTNDEEVA